MRLPTSPSPRTSLRPLAACDHDDRFADHSQYPFFTELLPQSRHQRRQQPRLDFPARQHAD